jgi:hypothetical protein
MRIATYPKNQSGGNHTQPMKSSEDIGKSNAFMNVIIWFNYYWKEMSYRMMLAPFAAITLPGLMALSLAT